MKTAKRLILLTTLACGTSLLYCACNKEASAPPAATPPAGPAAADAQKTATNTVPAMQTQAADAKTAADTALATAQQQTNAAVAAASPQVQGLMDKAKALVADKKYPEALSSLKDLSALKLSPEQQKWVDDLKQQIQKAMATQSMPAAPKSVGDVLPGGK